MTFRSAWALSWLLVSCGDSAPGGGSLQGSDCGRHQDCDDSDDCTVDRCVSGACDIAPVDCSDLDRPCHDGFCVAGVGCIAEPRPMGSECDDGLFCTDNELCDDDYACTGQPRDCSELDGPCAVGTCDEAAAACVAEPRGDGLACEDGLVCTVRGSCEGTSCVSQPFDCSALDGPCAVGRCDEDLASCVLDPLGPFPGLEGPIGDPSCDNGLDDDCNGLIDMDDPACDCPPCDDGDVCTFDGCDPDTHECFWTARAVDPASPVLSTSVDTPATVCMVAGSNARVLVWADLRDTDGAPAAGAVVTIGGVAATESAVQEGVYWREVVAEAAPGSAPLAVDVEWCGQSVTLDTAITVTHVPASTTTGGTSGCAPADGNLRVRVIAAETGAPVADASILVGLVEGMTLEHGPEGRFGGASSPASNVATTDAEGYAAFFDYAGALSGRMTVTAGAPGRAYFTIVDGSASDLVLPLPLAPQPAVPTTRYSDGTGSGPLTGCEEWDFGLVVPQMTLETLSTHDQNKWLGKKRCYDSGNLVFGTMVIPENQWVPRQDIGPLCLFGSMREATWSITLPDTAATGETQNASLNMARVALDLATGGETLFELLTVTQYRRLGFWLNETVPTPPISGRGIDSSENLPNRFSVGYSGQPPETDVVGTGLIDLHGTNGTGPLLMMGQSIHEWDDSGNSVNIPNSDLDAPAAPIGARRLAVLSAVYLDKGAHPAIPPNRIEGVSSVLIRDDGAGGAPFGAGGGNASVTDFLEVVGMTYSAPDQFTWEDASAAGRAPLYSVHELGVRTLRHLPVIPCESGNEVRTSLDVQWIVIKPYALGCGGEECFTLPELPASFPRAAGGAQQRSGFLQRIGSGTACSGTCPVAGESCADPDGGGGASTMCMGGSGTDADPYFTQDYLWQVHVYDLGLAPSFDFNAFEFSQRRALQTHESFNKISIR